MAIIFSPLANEEMRGAFKPRPGCAFMMIHSARAIAPIEREIEKRVAMRLHERDLDTIMASGTFGSKDYLDKIVQLIRGCGFGIAIFSEFTPARTLANIFFEIGICYVLGKDVIIVKTKNAPIPSDFIRNEWIEFDPADEEGFAGSMHNACRAIHENANYYMKLGEIAREATDTDYELAFERLRQAALLVRSPAALAQIGLISKRLAELSAGSPDARSYFRRLKAEVDQFIKLYP
ncbi:MAG: hypothetical protein ACHQF3_07545 [Alphaproteobacteria bacterium]